MVNLGLGQQLGIDIFECHKRRHNHTRDSHSHSIVESNATILLHRGQLRISTDILSNGNWRVLKGMEEVHSKTKVGVSIIIKLEVRQKENGHTVRSL